MQEQQTSSAAHSTTTPGRDTQHQGPSDHMIIGTPVRGPRTSLQPPKRSHPAVQMVGPAASERLAELGLQALAMVCVPTACSLCLQRLVKSCI